MDQEVDTFGAGVQRGVLCGAVLGAVLVAVRGGSTLSGEDAGTILVTFVVLGAFTGSAAGAVCGTVAAVLQRSAQRAGAAEAWWVAVCGALVAAAVTAGGLGLWPVFFKGVAPPGSQGGWVLVCAATALWQVRRVQHRFAG
ncbi:hypothetical protein [Kineococcus arenarius]|uniref:hypothetical protein n=1 Tax=Kineococcus sp. SYSU DK007 TaxID=3383128 RepID=UPI003D7F0E42